jgi:methylated-DNA-[protein]-cysteine S-methyltransferase
MSQIEPTCREIEADLVATAAGDAPATAVRRVEHHLGRCGECRQQFGRYQAIDGLVGTMRNAPGVPEGLGAARVDLESRLADLRSRIVAYRAFSSPMGPILIARSELGVSMVEYLGRAGGIGASRLRGMAGVEPVEGGAELEPLERELLEYVEGRRSHLEWPLDLRLARSEFHRSVLRATAGIPYGAVTSYGHIAAEIGRPTASRAVAQALRWNPLPIVVPCHRVIGGSGSLVGYAGTRIGLKERLLDVEGVPTERSRGTARVSRDSMYVLYPGDQEYCVPSCPSVTPTRHSQATLFSSRERAEAVGFEPCSTCRPDLHPLSR